MLAFLFGYFPRLQLSVCALSSETGNQTPVGYLYLLFGLLLFININIKISKLNIMGKTEDRPVYTRGNAP